MKLAKSIFASIALSSAAYAAAPACTLAPATATCQQCTSTCGCERPDYASIATSKFIESVPPSTPRLPGEPTGFWAEAGAFAGFSDHHINGAYPSYDASSTGTLSRLANPGAGSVNIVGADFTGGYDLTDYVAVTLNIGYGYGTATDRALFADTTPYREHVSVHTFSFMPGLRGTYDLSPQWTLFAGISAGIANESVKYKLEIDQADRYTSHDSKWGFAYSVQAGAQFHFTQSLYAYAAYEFRGSLAEPNLINNAGVRTRIQNYHVMRLGVGFKF